MIITVNIDPTAFSNGLFAVRWYGIMYATAFFTSFKMLENDNIFRKIFNNSQKEIDFFLLKLLIIILVGSKLGYLFFYASIDRWLSIAFSGSGLSFHGGLLGAVVAILYEAYKRKLNPFLIWDRAALYTPVGVFFGRIGNFLNSELFGRPTDGSWGFIFPIKDRLAIPRYPSQLFEAFGEGILLFLILKFIDSKKPLTGVISASLFMGYGAIRFIIEYYRQPDAHIGLFLGFSRGQYLCLSMILTGLIMLLFSLIKKNKI
jgi:phosphatidylglycerol:prolipoprotein diacylglycerol transferase